MTNLRESSDPSIALAHLGADPLRHSWALKMLYLHAPACRSLTLVQERAWACLTEMSTDASRWDRSEYPESKRIVALDGNDEALVRAALARAHPEGSVFKVGDALVRSLVAKLPRARVAQTFLAFSGRRPAGAIAVAFPGAAPQPEPGLVPEVEERRELDAESLELFAQNGYTEEELVEYVSRGTSWFRLRAGGRTLSACLIYETYTKLWEIGGVYTHPSARGRGYAKRVVAAAASALSRQGFAARYVCRSDNLASRAVAEGVGLMHDLTVEHFVIGANVQ